MIINLINKLVHKLYVSNSPINAERENKTISIINSGINKTRNSLMEKLKLFLIKNHVSIKNFIYILTETAIAKITIFLVNDPTTIAISDIVM